MLLRLLCLAALCLGGPARLLAQTYEPGYLVRSTGDTLRGEIENEFWEQPPTFIRFRPAADHPSELLRPRQLRAVSFTGGRYFRYEVLLLDHAAETRLQQLPRGNSVDMQPDSVLAEVLLTGPVELLRVARPGAVHFEVRRSGQPPLRLSERQYLGENERGGWSVKDGNNYRDQLAIYFIGCPAAEQAARAATYTSLGLGAVAKAYARNCAPAGPPLRSWLARAAPRRRVAFQGGVLAGGRFNRIESASALLAGGECTDCRPHPFGGLYAELLSPGRTSALYGELSLSPFRSQDAYYLGLDPASGVPQYVSASFRALLATARIGGRRFIPLAHDQQLVAGFSFEYNVVLAESPVPLTKTYRYNFPTEANAYAAPVLLPGLLLGWRHQRFTVSLDGQLYHSGRDLDGLGSILVGSSWAARLGLSYRLGRHPDAGAADKAQP